MSQSWEREYVKPTFISKDGKPQEDFLKFLKWLKKHTKVSLEGLKVLDAGCGTGRNAHYLAEKYDTQVCAFDFARSAIVFAEKNFSHPNISFLVHDMKNPLPYPDESFDIVIDIMASFSLSSQERKNYLTELLRVLKKSGYMYVRTLAKKGDKNAQFLIKNNGGEEKDTYIHPTLQTLERVFSEEDFKEVYGAYFEIIYMKQKSGYQKFDNRSFKRKYWNVYLQKND